jgi:hypothetical protein
MVHNAVLIGGVGLVASVAAWLLCRLTGYTVAAWVAPLAISALCLGLLLVPERRPGKVGVPAYLTTCTAHLAHRSVIVQAAARLERIQGQFKAALPS